jgi:predicted transcriptional regulator YheO
VAINGFINERKWLFKELNNRQKKDIIRNLYESGAFVEKHATDYVARTLSLGRATVFNTNPTN